MGREFTVLIETFSNANARMVSMVHKTKKMKKKEGKEKKRYIKNYVKIYQTLCM